MSSLIIYYRLICNQKTCVQLIYFAREVCLKSFLSYQFNVLNHESENESLGMENLGAGKYLKWKNWAF